MAVSATPVLERPHLREADHLRLLIWARWHSYRNALRSSSIQRAKFVTAILTYLLAGAGGIGSALAFFALGYSSGNRYKPALVGLAVFLIFALWQLAPVIFEATAPTIKFRDIARYPVSFRSFYLLHLAYGILDPAVIVGLVWLLFLWIGMLIGHPDWALQAVLPFALFAACNLFANRFLITLLDRLLATRRGRERVLLGVMLLLVGAQIAFYGFMPRFGSAGMKALGRALLPFWNWSPPGLATWTVNAPGQQYFFAIAAFLAYCLVSAGLLRWQLRSVFGGEIYSESQRRSGAVQVKPGWSLPLLSTRTSAIIEKELRYCFRDSRTLINMAMPSIFAIMIVISRGAMTKVMSTGLNLQSNEARIQVMFTTAAVVVLSYFAFNSLGFEGGGFDRWSLSPVRMRQILVAKNIAVSLLWAASFAAVNFVLFSTGNASFRLFGLTLLGVIYAGFGILAAGNQYSVRTPLKVEPGTITSKNMTEGMMIGNLMVMGLLGGSVWGLVSLARLWSMPWLTPVGLAALACVTAALYLLSLGNAARYLDRNLEKISAELR